MKDSRKLKIDWSANAAIIVDAEMLEVALGPLRIYLRSLNSEVWLASETVDTHTDGQDQPAAGKNDNLRWSRWAMTEEMPELRITPSLFDRALVVHPDYDFRLPPASEAKIFVRVPVNLKISAGKGNTILTEIKSQKLSNTWFGDFMTGELCYWLAASARRVPFIDQAAGHLCICSVLINNRSAEELLVSRLRMDSKALSIYEQAGQLWGSDTIVTYRGAKDGSQIEIKPGAPANAISGRLLNGPRELARKTFGFGTFGRLFDSSTP